METPTGNTFHDMLNRQKMTATQLKAFESPIPTPAWKPNQRMAFPSGVTVAPQPQSTPETVVELDAETAEFLKKYLPDNPPQGAELHQAILNDRKQYQTFQTDRGNGFASPLTLSQPVQTASPVLSSDPALTPASAFNSVLAQDFQDSNRVMPAVTQPLVNGQVSPASANAIQDFSPQLVAMRKDANPTFQSAGQRVPLTQVEMDMLQKQMQPLEESKHEGPIEAFGSFFMDILSGITFGLVHPKNEPPPQGTDRILYPFKKVLWDAPKDLIVDVPMSIYRTAGNAIGKKGDNPQLANAAKAEPVSARHHRSRRTFTRNFYT